MIRTYRLVLTGVAQNLSDAFGDGVGVVNAAHDIPLRQIVLQSQKAGADVFLGQDNTVTGTVFGVRLSPTESVPPFTLGPYDTGPMKLSDFWVFGTNTQVLTVLVVPY